MARVGAWLWLTIDCVCVWNFDVGAGKRVSLFGKMGLKWIAVAQIGLKLRENKATMFRMIFEPDF